MSSKSHIALVREGQEDLLRSGTDVTVNLRAGGSPETEIDDRWTKERYHQFFRRFAVE